MPTEQILIIDDSVAIASLLANEILPLGGYRAAAALGGEEGLEIIRKTRPDLVLCDLEMPGINGIEVLRTLQHEGLDMPTIMMTAFGSEAVAAQALRMGVKDYIIKPFTTEEILAAVERALTESRLKRTLAGLHNEIERQRQALVVIQAVSKSSEVGLGLDAFLMRVILAAVHAGGARAGYVGVLDGSSRLDIVATANLPGHLGTQVVLKPDSPLSQSIATGQPTQSRSDLGFWLHFPLVRSRRPWGAMCIAQRRAVPHGESKLEKNPIRTEYLYSALASLAAFAIENDRLRAQLGDG